MVKPLELQPTGFISKYANPHPLPLPPFWGKGKFLEKGELGGHTRPILLFRDFQLLLENRRLRVFFQGGQVGEGVQAEVL